MCHSPRAPPAGSLSRLLTVFDLKIEREKVQGDENQIGEKKLYFTSFFLYSFPLATLFSVLCLLFVLQIKQNVFSATFINSHDF